jgi:regulator of sigma E protease
MNWLPLGGFVKIKGEDGEHKGDNDSFASQKIWKRAIILSAGVTMNVILCAVALMFAFGMGSPQVIDDSNIEAVTSETKIQVISIIKDSPAEEAGVQLGDAIISINEQTFAEKEEVVTFMAGHLGEEVTVIVSRLGAEEEITATPIILEQTGTPGIGVALAKTGIISYPWYQAIWLGIKGTVLLFIQILIAFYTLIKNAIIGQPLGVDVAGPVGIAVITGQVARLGFVYLLQFTALLSLNLAIINFLPIPALDGGRVLFLIIEKIRRKPVNQKIEQIIHTVSFFVLIILILVVTGRDIWEYRSFFTDLWQKLSP